MLDDLKQKFPHVDWDECSIGEPAGIGIKLGFDGWGKPDILLDPFLPLDMSARTLDLVGKFKRVRSYYYVNNVHGDCTLTHAVRGLQTLVADGGELIIRALDTIALVEEAIKQLRDGSIINAQILEKFCFRPALDSMGAVYQQTLMGEDRLAPFFSGWKKQIASTKGGGPQSPESIRLDGIPHHIWDDALNINDMQESLERDWPRCIRCHQLATKMDANRAYYSRYCKDHYHEARQLCDKRMIELYSFEIRLKKE